MLDLRSQDLKRSWAVKRLGKTWKKEITSNSQHSLAKCLNFVRPPSTIILFVLLLRWQSGKRRSLCQVSKAKKKQRHKKQRKYKTETQNIERGKTSMIMCECLRGCFHTHQGIWPCLSLVAAKLCKKDQRLKNVRSKLLEPTLKFESAWTNAGGAFGTTSFTAKLRN